MRGLVASTVVLSFITAVAALKANQVVPVDRADDDVALLDQWQEVAESIGAGEPWPDCRAALESAIEKHPNSKYVRYCRKLIDDIRLTEEMEKRLGPAENVSPDDLNGKFLIYSKIDATRVLAPLQLYGRTMVWERNAQLAVRNDADVAYRLYGKDRPVIAQLIGELSDDAATRSVRVRRQSNSPPAVLRVCDIALGVIEARSRCRFRTDAQLHVPFSQISSIARQTTIDHIQRWWDKTRDMDPASAVVWQLEHGELDKPYQMLQVLQATGEKQAIIDYLSNHYRAGDAIDYTAAIQLVRAGSDEPLDYIRRAANDGRALTLDMARVIGAVGHTEDFALLARLAAADEDDPIADRADWYASMIVRAMRESDNRKSIPVLVSVVEGFLDRQGVTEAGEPAPPRRWPQHIIDAAVMIQERTGVNFGIDPSAMPDQMNRAMRQMLTWWVEDGQGIYDFHSIDPRAPGGIR